MHNKCAKGYFFMLKRIYVLLVTILVLFAGLSGRIGQIVLCRDYTVENAHNSISITVDKKYTNFYYRDMSFATNNKNYYLAIIRPNPKSLLDAKKILDKEDYLALQDELSKGRPVVAELKNKPTKTLNNIIIHCGYKSSNNCYQLFAPASNGLIKHLSKQIGEKKANYTVDAKGRLLDGDYGKLIDENYSSLAGYRVSIDKNIQDVVLKASEDMVSGTVLVINIKDASILACVNKPLDSYSIKAFTNYSVGSVFKIVVSTCALENNIYLDYTCTGSISVGDTSFSCQANHVHGKEHLKQALANSCNCYFVNLALNLGYERLSNTAKELGFMSSTKLCEGWEIKNAVFPSNEILKSKGQLALLGFGQGTLLSTPLQIGSVLCTIANGGNYISPQLVLSTVNDNGVSKNINANIKENVISKTTCDKLIEYMRYVVTDGTGRNANDYRSKSAGKTATAQTGQYYYGKEKMNTWFAGVYPYDKPQYAIVVMCENGTSGAENCCPIFRTIVENL